VAVPAVDRARLRDRLHHLRRMAIGASIAAFLAVLGLVATHPVGTQASSPPPSDPNAPDQSGNAGSGFGNQNGYVGQPPAYAPPAFHSRRS
jgi:hypothetical protein